MIWSTISLALREIGRNILRSSLTILGIVIGVAAVISMVTLGGGATQYITDAIQSLGSNLLIVRTGTRPGPGGVRSNAPPLKIDDAFAIQRDINGISALAPSASSSAIAVYGNENYTTTVTGTTNGFLDVRDWPVSSGRRFTESELKAGRLVCILGETVRKELFGRQNPIGSTIRLGTVSCQVIGVLESKGESTFGMDQDNTVLIPLRALQRRFTGDQNISLIYISAQSSDITGRIQKDIENLMRQRRRIKTGEENNFNVQDMAEIASTMATTTGVLTTFLGAVAAISLLVGGIGIMNIMLVSVTERTREIGIRLAIGALGREVLLQFLVEAIILSLLGGILGITLGLAGANIACSALGIPFVFNPAIIVIAFAFSGLVGILFGFFPARRAANLDPIEALRFE